MSPPNSICYVSTLIHTRYTDHTYIVLTLQKLVHMHPEGEDSDSESEEDESMKKPKRGRLSKWWRKLSNSKARGTYDDKQRKLSTLADGNSPTNGFVTGHTDGVDDAPMQTLRTIQRYRGGPNQERMAYMEKHSALEKKKLAVSAEQVSIFLTAGMPLYLNIANVANQIYKTTL